MDNLSDLLRSHSSNLPPQIRLVKDFVRQHFDQEVGVQLRGRDIIITVRSASLAGAIRPHSHRIKELLSTSPGDGQQAADRIILRVGSA